MTDGRHYPDSDRGEEEESGWRKWLIGALVLILALVALFFWPGWAWLFGGETPTPEPEPLPAVVQIKTSTQCAGVTGNAGYIACLDGSVKMGKATNSGDETDAQLCAGRAIPCKAMHP